MKPLVTLVIPVFNEEDNIDPFFEKMTPLLAGLESRFRFEILFTDNHSTDRTFEKLTHWHGQDQRVRVLRYSKNFGYQRSIFQGYLESRGNAVVQLDVDLQDPPELIQDFLNNWQAGYKLVYGRRLSRKEGLISRLVRRAFYRIINLLSEDHLPEEVGEFRLLDRCFIEEMRKYPDHQPYLRGLVATLGFKSIELPYHRGERAFGSTKFSFRSLFNMALDGILNHSVVPLRLATFIGLAFSIFSFLGLIVLVGVWFFYGSGWPAGWASLAVLVTGGFGINFLFMGIVGEYIGRIYRQLKKESVAIVEYRLERSTSELVD